MKTTHVICANDSVEAVVLQQENETQKAYQKRAEKILETLAKEYFERNKFSFQEDTTMNWSAYEVMRHRIFWHIHTVKTL